MLRVVILLEFGKTCKECGSANHIFFDIDPYRAVFSVHNICLLGHARDRSALVAINVPGFKIFSVRA